MRGDNNTAGRLGREATVRPTKNFFFSFTKLGFSSPHHEGPFLRETVKGRTTNKDCERHTSHEKSSNTFFLGIMCDAVCAGTHTHINGDINSSLVLFFWFLVSKAFGTNIYTSCTFIPEPDTMQQRQWYCVPLSKHVVIHGAGNMLPFSTCYTSFTYATAGWHCHGHSWGHVSW